MAKVKLSNSKGPETNYKTPSKTFYNPLLLHPPKIEKPLFDSFPKYPNTVVCTEAEYRRIPMNPQMDKLVRRTTIVATVTAAYFLLTADYGSEPNVLDPIKKRIQSAENSVKNFIFGSKTQPQESETKKLGTNGAKEHPY